VSLVVGESSEQTNSVFAIYKTYKARGAEAAARQFSASIGSKAVSKLEKPEHQEGRP